jgi:hypothetical protein
VKRFAQPLKTETVFVIGAPVVGIMDHFTREKKNALNGPAFLLREENVFVYNFITVPESK